MIKKKRNYFFHGLWMFSWKALAIIVIKIIDTMFLIFYAADVKSFFLVFLFNEVNYFHLDYRIFEYRMIITPLEPAEDDADNAVVFPPPFPPCPLFWAFGDALTAIGDPLL